MRIRYRPLLLLATILVGFHGAAKIVIAQNVVTDVGIGFDCSAPIGIAVGATVIGSLTVGGTLSLVITGSPCAAGKTFLLIDNDGTDPIIGTFTNVPEGGTVIGNGQAFRISYVGGSGNDLTATALSLGAIPVVSTTALLFMLVSLLVIALRSLQ